MQQQTVHALQASFKPLQPKNPNVLPQVPLAETIQSSPKFGGSVGSAGHVTFQSFMSPSQPPSEQADWTKLAHVQLVKDHHSVCNSIMLFGELHRLRSPARRVLLFPSAWAAELAPEKGGNYDPYMVSTRRLLKLAARRYRVELHPIAPLLEDSDAEKPDSYSLASVFALADLERAMVLETPGLLFETEVLDQVLAYSPISPLATFLANGSSGVQGGEVLLLTPGKDAFAALRASEAAKTSTDLDLLTHVLPAPLTLDPETSSEPHMHLIKSIGALHNIETDAVFNNTDFLATSAYIRFSDPKLPKGPEYDVPWAEKRDARPTNKEADWMWTKLYGLFAQKRMEICGLDLDTWREWE